MFTMRRPLLDVKSIEQRVADRLSRQQILERWPAPTMSFVLEEVVLQRPIGGEQAWRAQLERLLEVGSMRTVELQVLTTRRIEHPSLGGPFILITPKGKQQMAYLEVQDVSRLITDQEEVRVHAARYGIIRAQALPRWESLALIERMLGKR